MSRQSYSDTIGIALELILIVLISFFLQQVRPFDTTDSKEIKFCKTVDVIIKDYYNWESEDAVLEVQRVVRVRRQAAQAHRGRYRGQTQSQYLAIDQGNGKDEGKAEAHSDVDSSRASVST